MKYLYILSLITVSLTFVSCKKCKLPEEKITGEIADVRLFENTATLSPYKEVLLRSETENALYENLTVSFDDGLSYEEIDFSSYSVMGVRVTTECAGVFDKNVERDTIFKTITYTLTPHHCGTCTTGETTSDHWVLLPAVPADYNPLFVIKD